MIDRIAGRRRTTYSRAGPGRGRTADAPLLELRSMVTRMWCGWTARENAEAYERFLLTTMFPAMRSIPGFCGADVLQREDGGETAFVTLTRFDTLEAIREFAGEHFETPVLEPEARSLLSRYDERAQHFETSSFTL
jgi:heme-degrading monooxygenase HmoA